MAGSFWEQYAPIHKIVRSTLYGDTFAFDFLSSCSLESPSHSYQAGNAVKIQKSHTGITFPQSAHTLITFLEVAAVEVAEAKQTGC
jgi:hypothetical protein